MVSKCHGVSFFDYFFKHTAKQVLVWFLTPRWLFGLQSPMLGRLVKAGCGQTKDLWRSLEQANNIRNEILSAWTSKDLDVVLAPGFAYLAPHHTLPARLGAAAPVTAAYNVLNFPVGALPMIRKTMQDQVRFIWKNEPYCILREPFISRGIWNHHIQLMINCSAWWKIAWRVQ